MRNLGVLACRDCGEQHVIHVNGAGQLVALEGCARASAGGLGELVRGQVAQQLRDAAAELSALLRMTERDDADPGQLAVRLAEVHRRLVRAENALPRARRRGAAPERRAPSWGSALARLGLARV